MDEFNDPTPPPTPARGRWWPLLVLALLVGTAYFLARRVSDPAPLEANTMDFPGEPGAPSDMPETAVLPPGDPDERLHTLAREWSTEPLYGRWLATLSMRHVVAAAQLTAQGDSPKQALPFLLSPGEFAVREEPIRPGEERIFISPAAYARYDPVGRLAGSVDAAAAGDAYAQLRPYADAVFAEIGRPGQAFDEVLTSAIRRLVQVRFPEGEIELVPKGAVYAFKDPTLEGLSPAAKQLLRMGAQNGKVVQRQLRTFASHADLELSPAER